MKKVVVCMMLALASFGTLAKDEKQLTPEQMGEYMDVMITKMLTSYTKPKFAKMEAAYYKNLYDALIEKGFTKEQAMRILLSKDSLISSN